MVGFCFVCLAQSWEPLMTLRSLTPANWTPTGVRAATGLRAMTSSKTPAHTGTVSITVGCSVSFISL